jgi:integrase
MPKDVCDAILQLVESYQGYEGLSQDSLVFGMNKHISSTTLKRVQEQACVASGVRIIRIHDLRHSHVSLLVSMGFNPVEIAKRLGHTVEMVNNTYSHLFTSSQQSMADKLNEYAEASKEKVTLDRVTKLN